MATPTTPTAAPAAEAPPPEEILQVDENSPFTEALRAQENLEPSKMIARHYIPRAKKGEITREHEQYNLTYAMMVGIEHTVRVWSTKETATERASRHRTLK